MLTLRNSSTFSSYVIYNSSTFSYEAHNYNRTKHPSKLNYINVPINHTNVALKAC